MISAAYWEASQFSEPVVVNFLIDSYDNPKFYKE